MIYKALDEWECLRQPGGEDWRVVVYALDSEYENNVLVTVRFDGGPLLQFATLTVDATRLVEGQHERKGVDLIAELVEAVLEEANQLLSDAQALTEATAGDTQAPARDAAAEERSAILGKLRTQNSGSALRRRTLEAQLPGIPPAMLRHQLGELIREGHVTNYGGWLRRAGRGDPERKEWNFYLPDEDRSAGWTNHCYVLQFVCRGFGSDPATAWNEAIDAGPGARRLRDR